jgi:ATP-dependent DNA ligase
MATVLSPPNGKAGCASFTRNGFDWTDRYPRISEAVAGLPTASATIDGEAVWCTGQGLAIFDKSARMFGTRVRPRYAAYLIPSSPSE